VVNETHAANTASNTTNGCHGKVLGSRENTQAPIVVTPTTMANGKS
jgi:hypothetical protein